MNTPTRAVAHTFEEACMAQDARAEIERLAGADRTIGLHPIPNPPATVATYADPCGGEWDIRKYADGGWNATQTNGGGLSPVFDTLAEVIAHLDRCL